MEAMSPTEPGGIPEALAAAYGLGLSIRVTPLDGTRNRNFAAETPSGMRFIRRRFAGYAQPERVAFDDAAAFFLHERGVAVVSPLRTIAGETCWSNAGEVWQVFPFVCGAAMLEGEPAHCETLGNAVARFHREGERFPGRFGKIGPRGETCPREIVRAANQAQADAPSCACALERYLEWTQAAARALPDAAYAAIPHTLIHGDLQPANVLFHEGRVAALVDLDWCAWQPRIYDLAFALLFCCAVRAAPIRGGDIWSLTQPPRVDAVLARAFLDGYESCAWPISALEREALPAQIMLSWCHSRVAGALKVPPSDRAAFLARPPEQSRALVPDWLRGG